MPKDLSIAELKKKVENLSEQNIASFRKVVHLQEEIDMLNTTIYLKNQYIEELLNEKNVSKNIYLEL